MPVATIQHPDPVKIRAEVVELVRRGDVQTLTDIIVTAQQDRCALQLRVQELLHETYGSRSEKLRGPQLELVKLADQMSTKPSDGSAAAAKLPELPPPPPAPNKPPRKRGGRKKLSADLPRRRVVLQPPESDRVASNGTPLRCIGEDVREALNWIPGRLEVIEYVLPKYADPENEPGVVQASPALPLPGALPTAATLAHVIVEKYRWHLPMYRVAQKLKASGADISTATLNSWCRLAAPLLVWFYTALREQAVNSRVLGTDDTPVKTLDRSTERNVKKARVWHHVGEGAVAFQYTPNWSGEPVRKILCQHAGPLQSDGYKGLDKLFDENAPPTRARVGCMMHARRGFKKALDAKDDRAAVPLAFFRRLYQVEEYADLVGARGGEARRDIRRTYSAPVMDALKAWLETEGPRAVPKSPLGKAVTYATNQWPTLIRFLDDGDIPLDNGRVERGLRPVGRGRKAWLFFGSDAGGERGAIFMTCIANCVLHEVDPEAWLTDVFTKLGEGWKGAPADLLPAAWAKQQAQDAQAQQAAA